MDPRTKDGFEVLPNSFVDPLWDPSGLCRCVPTAEDLSFKAPCSTEFLEFVAQFSKSSYGPYPKDSAKLAQNDEFTHGSL